MTKKQQTALRIGFLTRCVEALVYEVDQFTDKEAKQFIKTVRDHMKEEARLHPLVRELVDILEKYYTEL